MNEINEQLKGISELVTRIDAKVLEITTKLDELIKALHEYDDDMIMEPTPPCVGHDAASWEHEDELNKRMDVIGQNGNEGTHYVSNEEADEDAATFSDYGMRIAKEVMSNKDNIRVGKDKSNNTQPKQKQYYKNNRSKRSENKK